VKGNTITYRDVGVDYSAMDPFKRACQIAGRTTAGNVKRLGAQEVSSSRGESAYLMEFPDFFLAHVQEGLGTLNVVADEMVKATGDQRYYRAPAISNAAMILNDIITSGATPLSLAIHVAAGASDWFTDEARYRSFIEGCVEACNLAGCVWGGGESPTLKGIVDPSTVEISGSATGMITPKSLLIDSSAMQDGDAIIIFGSSGVHANGFTAFRKIGDNLPNRYLTNLPDGRTYGEALLQPTVIYAPAIAALQQAGINIHYAVNITGHGWRKLMRATQSFVYVIDKLPTPDPLFDFIQQQGNIGNAEMWGNYNMGGGFAVYVAHADALRAVAVASEALKAQCVSADNLGHIEKCGDDKKVIITPVDMPPFEADTLQVR